ncbi:hypothetical protein [Kitasatospora purpeofusca]|uniref:hypothetical protein n=1 Tax=Kitasatospora purpeofusca TaxID=67352 RepID=UPI003826E13A
MADARDTPAGDRIVDRYTRAVLDGDKTMITAILEAVCDYDRANPTEPPLMNRLTEPTSPPRTTVSQCERCRTINPVHVQHCQGCGIHVAAVRYWAPS